LQKYLTSTAGRLARHVPYQSRTEIERWNLVPFDKDINTIFTGGLILCILHHGASFTIRVFRNGKHE
jgi:hemin uptake protein HemP